MFFNLEAKVQRKKYNHLLESGIISRAPSSSSNGIWTGWHSVVSWVEITRSTELSLISHATAYWGMWYDYQLLPFLVLLRLKFEYVETPSPFQCGRKYSGILTPRQFEASLTPQSPSEPHLPWSHCKLFPSPGAWSQDRCWPGALGGGSCRISLHPLNKVKKLVLYNKVGRVLFTLVWIT